MVDFLQITLLLHQKVVYNFLNAEQFLEWDEVVAVIFKTENKVVFECTLCVVSEHKRFDHKWEGSILGLMNEIAFTKDQDVALVSSLRRPAPTFPLLLLLDNPLLPKFKTSLPARGVSLVISAPHGSSCLTPPPVIDIPLHFKELIELIKGNNVLAKRQTP